MLRTKSGYLAYFKKQEGSIILIPISDGDIVRKKIYSPLSLMNIDVNIVNKILKVINKK